MTEHEASLAERLGRALEETGHTIERLAEQTKIPPATIRALLGSQEPAVLPQRAYLRGHVGIVARELGLEVSDVLAQFDRENPREHESAPIEMARFHPVMVTVAAGLGCIAIIAVILAFVR